MAGAVPSARMACAPGGFVAGLELLLQGAERPPVGVELGHAGLELELGALLAP